MSFHDDERLLAAVAAALGETIALVRRRGLSIDSRWGGSEPPPASSRFQREADGSVDALDLAAYGIDWGRCGSRAHRRFFFPLYESAHVQR